MKPGIATDATKQVKNLAGAIAKQLLEEPLEMGKTAARQVTGTESIPNPNFPNPNFSQEALEQNQPQEEKALEEKLEIQGQSQIKALEKEIEEISDREKIRKEQEKAGEQNQELIEKAEQKASPLREPSTKKSRNLLGVFGIRKPESGDKLPAKRQEHRVERIMHPTG